MDAVTTEISGRALQELTNKSGVGSLLFTFSQPLLLLLCFEHAKAVPVPNKDVAYGSLSRK